MANDGGFLGFQEVQVTHYALNNTDPNQVLQFEKLFSVDGSTGAAAGRDNPDPRRGRLERREVWSKNPADGGVLLASTDYDWRAYWLEGEVYGTVPQRLSYDSGSNRYPATVIQQHAVTETLYTPGQASVSSSTVYTYETVYGNTTGVAGAGGRHLAAQHADRILSQCDDRRGHRPGGQAGNRGRRLHRRPARSCAGAEGQRRLCERGAQHLRPLCVHRQQLPHAAGAGAAVGAGTALTSCSDSGADRRGQPRLAGDALFL
ncbi:MAG: hypothetical protein V9G12_10090 [Microthrixaceae bacterium]